MFAVSITKGLHRVGGREGRCVFRRDKGVGVGWGWKGVRLQLDERCVIFLIFLVQV